MSIFNVYNEYIRIPYIRPNESALRFVIGVGAQLTRTIWLYERSKRSKANHFQFIECYICLKTLRTRHNGRFR